MEKKFEWKNINVNKNMIVHETDRAVLIKMPNDSDTRGMNFGTPENL